MDREVFEHHLAEPLGRAHLPTGARTGSAGGSVCGDLVSLHVAVAGGRVVDAGFDAEGCGALSAAASVAVGLVRGAALLDAARISPARLDAELGGLSPGKRHAVDLVADALHVALGQAAVHDARLDPAAERTLVAMSGGVDSAVAALLAARAGREVACVTLELWRDAFNDAEASCCSASAVRLARSVAHAMGLPHFTVDLRDAFRAGVVEPWLAEHRAGLTPNPCVRCNGRVRIDAMVELADRLGAADLATGHYARLARGAEGRSDGAPAGPDVSRRGGAAEAETGVSGPLLRMAVDEAKDQTYMLSALAPATLARLRFPLGELTKPRVRELAAQAGLPVAARRESQDLCFLAGTGKAAFLARHGAIEDRPGEIIDEAGTVLGEHRGVHHYTVGQRRGLGGGSGEPRYVVRTEPDANRVVVGPHAALRTERIVVRDATLHRAPGEVDRVKLRYRSRALPCRVAGASAAGSHERLALELAEPASGGAAPGQTACLLAGDVVLGWGTIAGS